MDCHGRLIFGICLGAALCHSAVAQAEDTAEQSGRYVADGIDGLPGLYRVGVPGTAGPRLGSSFFLGYGYTEPQNGETEGHHRLASTLAVGGAWFPFLAGALRLDFRHDIHGEDPLGADSGSVIDFTPMLRSGFALQRWLHLGAEARLYMSGATVESGIAAPSFDGRLLGSFFAPGGFTIATLAGFRSAQGGSAVDADMLRPGDRVVLGVSEFPAVLTGVGVSKAFGPASVYLEGTWDILVGEGAPPALESPLRIDLGGRYALVDGLDLQGIVEVSPGARAPSLAGDPLVPIEPRFTVTLGVSVRLPELFSRAGPEGNDEPKSADEPQVEEAPQPAAPPPVVPEVGAPPPSARLEVVIVDETGHPISDAKVKVEIPAAEDRPAQSRDVPLESVNIYVLPEVPVGRLELTIEAELLQSHTQEVTLSEEAPAVVQVKLRKAAGGGSQLRGLVRSYSGVGIEASVRVEPGGLAAVCDQVGEFVLDLPPGSYSVIIEADGYVPQKRQLRVRKESVTVLNADLQKEK